MKAYSRPQCFHGDLPTLESHRVRATSPMTRGFRIFREPGHEPGRCGARPSLAGCPASPTLGRQRQSRRRVPEVSSLPPPLAPTSAATPRAPRSSPVAEPRPGPNGSGPASARALQGGADSNKVFVRKAGGATQISRARTEGAGRARPMGAQTTPPRSARLASHLKDAAAAEPPAHRIPGTRLSAARLRRRSRSPCSPSASRSPPSLTSSSCSCRR